MRAYLQQLVLEQIERTSVLKSMIPYPLECQELDGLANRCTALIDGVMQRLSDLKLAYDANVDDEVFRWAYRRYKSLLEELEWYEQYGIAVLKMGCEDLGHLNKLLAGIHKESRIPLSPAAVASFSDKYYFFAPKVNVVFVPAAEHRFLLHMPDLYHELGHYVSSQRQELRLEHTNDAYNTCLASITAHFRAILKRRSFERGPEELIEHTLTVLSRWRKVWFEEFFCDAFACYTVGPAYAWAHTHLVMKRCNDAYEHDPDVLSTHPADEARFRLQLLCLEGGGFSEQVESLRGRWSMLPPVKAGRPDGQYHEAYPDDLLRDVAKVVFVGLKGDGIVMATPEQVASDTPSTISAILNTCWAEYWRRPGAFTGFEREMVNLLKKTVSN